MVFYKNCAIEIGFVAMVSFLTRNQQQQIQILKKSFTRHLTEISMKLPPVDTIGGSPAP